MLRSQLDNSNPTQRIANQPSVIEQHFRRTLPFQMKCVFQLLHRLAFRIEKTVVSKAEIY